MDKIAMRFIVFEGIDGCGKSTQIKLLTEHLEKKSVAHILTREPGGTPLAEEIRGLLLKTDGEAPVPKAELLLYEAGRAQHCEKVIVPNLKKKKWVISDRFAASTVAFQAAGRKLKPKDITTLNAYATSRLQPDLTILLDISVEESNRRMGRRADSTGVARDRFEQEKKDFYSRVRKSYLQQAKSNSKRWLVIDGTRSVDQISAEILEIFLRKKWLN
jgi:dTMP kinase